MVARSLIWISFISLASCSTHWVDDTATSGSTVTYEPVRDRTAADPTAPPARTVTLPPSEAQPLPPAPAFVLPVRYEPILDGPVDHASQHAPIDDDPLDGGDRLDQPPSDWPPKFPRSGLHGPVDASIYDVVLTPDGLALPYPTAHMFRGFGRCRGQRHHHEAIDLGGVGPDWGVGTPVRSMARAEVIFIGTGDDDPDKFGRPDKRRGSVVRGDRRIPRFKDIEPYGRVYFFTRKKGRWRSGNVIVTRVIDGSLAEHSIRYLHVAAIHPDVEVGTIVERGQEIALMGGTGVQVSAPHLHLDIQAPDGRRLDVAPLLGLPPTASCEAPDQEVPDTPPATSTPEPEASVASAPDDGDPRTFELRDVAVSRCKTTTRHEDFSSGRYASHVMQLPLVARQKVSVELLRGEGRWKPRLEIAGDEVGVKELASGKIGSKARSTITAERDTEITITVTGWDGAPPKEATYALSIGERCRR